MPRIILSLFSAMFVALAAPSFAAPDAGFDAQETSSLKCVKHEDGSRCWFDRSPSGIRKKMYNAQGKLTSVTLYSLGKYNELRSCLIFDGNKTELFFVNYGYDKRGRLVEEQMKASVSKNIVRRFIYTYDDAGNRSKPLCITLVKDALKSAGPTYFDQDKIFDKKSK